MLLPLPGVGTPYAKEAVPRVTVSLRPFEAALNRSTGVRQDPREIPLYDVSEAAGFVGVSQTALVEWMQPAGHEAASAMPLLQLMDPSSGRLSFANLAEAHILEATRKHNVSASEVRTAIEVIQGEHGTPHPLLTRDFYKRGKWHLVECLASSSKEPQDASSRSERLDSLAMDLERYLGRIERDANDDPYQLFPVRHNENRYVSLNINVVAGHPVIVGTGLRVRHLSDLVRAGESIGSVANRYQLDEGVLVEALAFLLA
jgi:uncharacterized protein (DUF433 family)